MCLGGGHAGAAHRRASPHTCLLQVLEWGTITAYRGGWFSLWNGLDVATYILQVVIAVLHLSRHVTSGYVSIACSLQCILLLLRWAGMVVGMQSATEGGGRTGG